MNLFLPVASLNETTDSSGEKNLTDRVKILKYTNIEDADNYNEQLTLSVSKTMQFFDEARMEEAHRVVGERKSIRYFLF